MSGFSNDDSNKDGFISKTVLLTFWYILMTSISPIQRETSWRELLWHEGHKYAMTNFSFLTWIQSLRIQLLGNSPTFRNLRKAK